MHAGAVDADDRLGQEAGGHAHLRGDLAADELVELDLVGRSDRVAVAVVDLELRGRNLGVVLLVLEAHRALHLGGDVDELAQRIAGQRVVVAALVDVLELAGLVVLALGVDAVEEEAFDLVGGVEGVAVLRELLVGEGLEQAAHVAGVGRAVLVDDLAEDQHLAGAEDVGGRVVEGAPVEAEAKIALALRGEAADGGAVEGEIVEALDEELLVVVEHVQPAFEVGEEHGDGLDTLVVGEPLQTLFLELVDGDALLALFFGLEVQLLKLFVRQLEKVAVFARHSTPWGSPGCLKICGWGSAVGLCPGVAGRTCATTKN